MWAKEIGLSKYSLKALINMKFHKKYKYAQCVILIFLFHSVVGQSLKQEKMEQLSYMIGEWVGTSKLYENGLVSQEGPAFEKIAYNLDKNILVIDLNSAFLQLHTIIYYDEKDQKYYYYPFSKNGVNRYPAEFKNGQLIVWPNEKKRFIFSRTSDGGFMEYGEKLVDGEWIKYFEDTFKNTQ